MGRLSSKKSGGERAVGGGGAEGSTEPQSPAAPPPARGGRPDEARGWGPELAAVHGPHKICGEEVFLPVLHRDAWTRPLRGCLRAHLPEENALSLHHFLSLSLHSTPPPPNPPHYYHNKLSQLFSPNPNNILYTLLLYIFKIFLLKKKILGRRRLLAGA